MLGDSITSRSLFPDPWAFMLGTQNPQAPHTYCIQITHNACTHTAYDIRHMHPILTAHKICTPLSYPQPACARILHRRTVCAHNGNAQGRTLGQRSPLLSSTAYIQAGCTRMHAHAHTEAIPSPGSRCPPCPQSARKERVVTGGGCRAVVGAMPPPPGTMLRIISSR